MSSKRALRVSGARLADVMGTQAPPGLLGIHLNWPFTVPPDIDKAIQTGEPLPSDLSADERRACEQIDLVYKKGLGYALEMANRPQTLYGIEDSPVGLAAWFLDHDARSYEMIARVFDGEREGLTRDDVLDNITLTWLTNTAISCSRIYWENKLSFFTPRGVTIPVAVSAFPDEVCTTPLQTRRSAEERNRKSIASRSFRTSKPVALVMTTVAIPADGYARIME